MIKRVLIAVDDLEPDLHVVDYGIDLARQLNAEIGLVDVARLSFGYIEAGIYPEDIEQINHNRTVKTVEEIKSRYPDDQITDFEPVGDPVEEILEIIGEWKPDMLITGHHKKSFFQRFSETARERRLVNRIDIPVLIVPCD